jgi:hypothetical protein
MINLLMLTSFILPPDQSARILCTTKCAPYMKSDRHWRLDFLPSSSLVLFVNDSESAAEIDDRLNLNDRFGRWRFLQNLLDGETSPDDTNLVLQIILENFFRLDQTADCNEPMRDDTSSDNASILKQTVLEKSLQVLIHPTNKSNEIADVELLALLEKLLPDKEEEDAWKSLGELICELHGREAVKVDENANLPTWKARLLISQIMLHFDFLSNGLDECIGQN